MFVCVCHAVPESAVVKAAAAGLSAAEVAQVTSAGTSCGRCASVLAAVVARTRRCERTGAACTGCHDRDERTAPWPDHPERDAR